MQLSLYRCRRVRLRVLITGTSLVVPGKPLRRQMFSANAAADIVPFLTRSPVLATLAVEAVVHMTTKSGFKSGTVRLR